MESNIILPSHYPQMTVELNDKRKDTNHGVKPPTKEGTDWYNEQLQDMFYLCEESYKPGFNTKVKDILFKYAPVELIGYEIEQLMESFNKYGHRDFATSWMDICNFVKDDECTHYSVRKFAWYKTMNLELQDDKKKGFIDGTGTGIYASYADRVDKALEEMFDIKHHYKARRPLEYIYNKTGIDMSPMASYIHPGHYSYGAGHGVKFFETTDVGADWYEMGHRRLWSIFLDYILAMGRSGILVHLPEDNLVAGAVADLPEFNNWKIKK